MIPRTFPSTYASNGQQQMLVHFLTDVTGLQRWSDYIPVKLAQTGTEDSYANNGYIDIAVLSPLTASTQAWKEYIPVYVDDEATDTWTVNATGYIPYGYALFGDASMQLDFTNGAALDSRITFTRSTTATRTNSSGLIESVAINGPRFDYNPVTLAPKGLLIEEQRTNLLTYSEQFDNAAWTKTRATVIANAIVSPDGTADADKLVEDTTASNTHLLTQGISFTSGAAYTFSIFAKQAEAGRYIQLSLPSAAFGSTLRGAFDLTNGTFAVSASTTGSITPVGNGWYKCSITGTATATISATLGVFIANSTAASAAAVTYTGDGTSGIYIWGAQLEAGAFATSYIPTTTAAATRAADVATMIGANFSNWYNADEGTLFADASPQVSNAGGSLLFEVNDATASNRIGVAKLVTTGNASMPVLVGGATQVSTNNGAWTSSGKLAGAYAVNDFASVLNGSAASTDTSGTLPVVTQATIGARGDGAARLNGTIKRLAYFPRRLSNAELQGITS